MAKQPLDTRPARTDLTDRECAKLIGACLGGLVEMADVDTVKRAVVWWAETDEAWAGFLMAKGQFAAALEAAQKSGSCPDAVELALSMLKRVGAKKD